MDTMTSIDLVVLSLPDKAVIDMITANEYYKQDDKTGKHQEFIDLLILGLERMYGAGCYHIWTVTGELPSQQVV